MTPDCEVFSNFQNTFWYRLVQNRFRDISIALVFPQLCCLSFFLEIRDDWHSTLFLDTLNLFFRIRFYKSRYPSGIRKVKGITTYCVENEQLPTKLMAFRIRTIARERENHNSLCSKNKLGGRSDARHLLRGWNTEGARRCPFPRRPAMWTSPAL